MDKKQKVWIRGCEGKGADVIQKLVALGCEEPAIVTMALAFDPGLIFFISHLGGISHTDGNSELARIIMEEYIEIKLDETVEDEPVNNTKEQPEFKVDDIVLRRDKRNGKWKVYQYWYLLTMGGLFDVDVIPYNDETKHLLNTTDDYEL